jgi:hypothetical protein
MIAWEYCILSGIETSLKRKLSLSLTFSSSGQERANKNLEIELDRNRSEEMYTGRILGDLGGEGWELVAFNRANPRFEAVLKRPVGLSERQPTVGVEMEGRLQS